MPDYINNKLFESKLDYNHINDDFINDNNTNKLVNANNLQEIAVFLARSIIKDKADDMKNVTI